MARNLKMTQGHPGRLMMLFSLPLMLGNVFQQMYTVVDTAIVGKGVGMTALASLGTVDWLNWMFISVAQGLTQGFSVLTAQKFGQSDEEGLKRSIGLSFSLTAGIGLLLTLIGQLGLDVFLELLRVPEMLRENAELYSRVILAGIPVMIFYNFCASVLRAVGDSKTPFYAMIIASVTNIALDCVAVFAMGWGVAGAAGATVFSQCVACGICAVKIFKSPLLRFEKKHAKPELAGSRRLLYLGVPMAMQNIAISISGMVVQSVVNGFDTGFIAGFTATNKLYGVLEIAALSYGYAVTTYTGQNFGAGLWERIKKGVHWAELISVVTSVVIGGAMILLGRPITMLFISSEDPQLVIRAGDIAYHYLFVMSASLPILYLLYAYRSVLQGIGNTTIPLLSGVVEFVIRVALAMTVSYFGGREEIFLAEPFCWIGATTLLGVSCYYHTARLNKLKNEHGLKDAKNRNRG